MVDKLAVNDPRVRREKATIHGHVYQYLLAGPPPGQPATGTLLLVHGFPDLSFGWRYQVPMLAEQLGLRVIVPDMLGYGGTDAPDALAPYAFKKICEDLVALVAHVEKQPVDDVRFFLGGHDWGGAVVWRMVLWQAVHLQAVFSVCVPFFGPAPDPFIPLEALVKIIPSFQYQLQFASEDVVREVQTPERIRQFLNTLYGGKADKTDESKTGKVDNLWSSSAFSIDHGIHFDRLDDVGPSPLLEPAEIDYYVDAFSRHGLRGPTNWYRMRPLNHEDEKALRKDEYPKIAIPALMVTATGDPALPASMADGMDDQFEKLTRVSVEGSHWVLWENSEEANKQIKAFLEPLLEKPAKAFI